VRAAAEGHISGSGKNYQINLLMRLVRGLRYGRLPDQILVLSGDRRGNRVWMQDNRCRILQNDQGEIIL
jgi:hypothetical protein